MSNAIRQRSRISKDPFSSWAGYQRTAILRCYAGQSIRIFLTIYVQILRGVCVEQKCRNPGSLKTAERFDAAKGPEARR